MVGFIEPKLISLIMKFYLLLIATTIFFILPSDTKAQDPIFGQFYRASTHLNPAMAGVYNGRFRVQSNFREQWSSILPNKPFRTIGASFEYKVKVLQGDFMNFSGTILNDQAGTSNFTTNRGNLGFSYLKQLTGGRYNDYNSYLVAGGQFGFGQHSLDYGGLWFSAQYDGANELVDNSLSTGENLNNNSTDVYTDFNAGLLWYTILDHNFSFHAGGALQHIAEPNISFMENDEEILPRRFILHGGAELPFSDNLSILPAALVTFQGPSRTIISGANLRYTNRDWDEVALRVGMWGQISNKLEDKILLNSMIFNAILEMEKWSVGISYDINTSSVSDLSNGRGAYEISFIYTQPAKYKQKVECPKY